MADIWDGPPDVADGSRPFPGGAPLPYVPQGLVRYRGIRISPRLQGYLQRLEDYAAHIRARIHWTSGYRTELEQEELQLRYESGDPSVPFEPLPYELSKHRTGDAADGETFPREATKTIGAYAIHIGLGWDSREPWHFELPGRGYP